MEQNNQPKAQTHKLKYGQEPQYKEKYYKIQNVVGDLNQKLSDLFQKKQNQLIDEYTNQMIKVKQQLNQLKSHTNEDEIRKKFNKKKGQLEFQRDKYIQSSIYFCNKCEVFKQRLSKTIHQARDLENQIKFLTNQIKQANSSNKMYKYVVSKYNYNDLVNSKKYIESIANSMNSLTKNEYPEKSRYHQLAESKLKTETKRNIITLKNLVGRIQGNSINNNNQRQKLNAKVQLKIKNILQNNSLNETYFEKMFKHSVLAIKQKKKQKKKQDKRYLKTSPKSKLQEYDTQIYDAQLNDYDKKNIIQHFLSKEQVKRYLYQLIFKDIQELEKDKRETNGLQIFDKNFI